MPAERPLIAYHPKYPGVCVVCWCRPELRRVTATYRGLHPDARGRLRTAGPTYRSYCRCTCHDVAEAAAGETDEGEPIPMPEALKELVRGTHQLAAAPGGTTESRAQRLRREAIERGLARQRAPRRQPPR